MRYTITCPDCGKVFEVELTRNVSEEERERRRAFMLDVHEKHPSPGRPKGVKEKKPRKVRRDKGLPRPEWTTKWKVEHGLMEAKHEEAEGEDKV